MKLTCARVAWYQKDRYWQRLDVDIDKKKATYSQNLLFWESFQYDRYKNMQTCAVY